jgi:PAS domain S-box-containing protein
VRRDTGQARGCARTACAILSVLLFSIGALHAAPRDASGYSGETADAPPGAVVRLEAVTPEWPQWFTFDAAGLLLLQGALVASLLLRRRRGRTGMAELRENEQRLRLATEAVGLAVWSWNVSRNSIAHNPQAAAMLGIAPDTACTYAALLARVHPEDRQRVDTNAQTCQATRGDFECDFRILLPDGSLRWIASRGRCHGRGATLRVIGVSIDITRRKQTELALRESEARYKNIVDAQTEMVCRFLPDGTLTFVNPAYCRHLGKGEERLLGHTFWPFIPPEEREIVRAHLFSLTAEKPVAVIEHKVVVANGETRWHHWTDRGIFDEHGAIREFQSVGRDITERKRVMLALQESEQRFRRMADAAPVFVWRMGPDGACVYVNRRWCDLTGRTAEQALGSAWIEAHHPEERETLRRFFCAAFAARKPFEIEHRLQRKDGEYRWILNAAVPLFEGDAFAGYIACGFDITDRRRAEDQQALLAAMVTSSDDAIVTLDLDSKITSWNPAAERLFDLTIADARGKDVRCMVSEGREEEIAWLVRKGKSGEAVSHFETTRCRPDGSVFNLTVTASPIRNMTGAVTGVSLTIRDVTGHRRAELELELLRRELAHVGRVAMMGELTASLAHELNQPLTAIVNNARAGEMSLEQAGGAATELREILRDVAADATRAGEVIRRMRGLLKKGEFGFSVLNMNEIAQEVFLLTRSDGIVRNVAIELDLASNLPPVRGDRIQLQQVLLNLILNGLEAAGRRDSAERRLCIRTERTESGTLRVAVQDSGDGFTADALERAFQPFFSTKADGLGMGLAISRSILAAHSGQIWAANNPEGGATVWFTLPTAG